MFEIFIKNSWLIPLLPFVSFVIIIFFTFKNKKLSTFISIFAISLSFVYSLFFLLLRLIKPSLFPKEIKIPIAFFKGVIIEAGILLDDLSILMMCIVGLVATLVQIYSIGYLEGEDGISRYYACHSLFASSMLGLCIVNNFLLLYLCWELVGLCSYLLIGHWYRKESASKAALKAFVTTRFGDTGLLIAILILFILLGTFNYNQISKSVELGILHPLWLSLICILIFLGAVGKSAQFPLHVWLPDAMEGPTPVSALIHAATMVAAGVFLVARCSFLFSESFEASNIVAFIGAFTALFASTIAVAQNDIKRILAYSTCSQLGYMMAACGLLAYQEGMFHLTTHAFFKALLFLAAGCVIHHLHTNDIYHMGGLRKKMPIIFICFFIGGLSLCGIFPTCGFFSKDAIIHKAFIKERYDIFYMLCACVFVTSFYIFRAIFVAFCGKLRYTKSNHIHEAKPVMTVPIMILAGLSLIGGIFSPATFGLKIAPHKEVSLHSPPIAEFLLFLLITQILAAFGIFCAYLCYRKKEKEPYIQKKSFFILKEGYFIDSLYEFLIVRALWRLKDIKLAFDLIVIDKIVNSFSVAVRVFSNITRLFQTSYLNNYLFFASLGFFFLLLFLIFSL